MKGGKNVNDFESYTVWTVRNTVLKDCISTASSL